MTRISISFSNVRPLNTPSDYRRASAARRDAAPKLIRKEWTWQIKTPIGASRRSPSSNPITSHVPARPRWNWVGDAAMAHAAPDPHKGLLNELHFSPAQSAFPQLSIQQP